MRNVRANYKVLLMIHIIIPRFTRFTCDRQVSASVCSLAEWSQEVKRRSPSRLLALLPVLVIGRELSGAPETPTAVGHTRAPAAISLSPLLMELSRELVMNILCLLFSKLPPAFPRRVGTTLPVVMRD